MKMLGYFLEMFPVTISPEKRRKTKGFWVMDSPDSDKILVNLSLEKNEQ